MRHCPAGTAITVRLQRDPEGFVARVEDDGPGIPKAERENVFRRLYRLEKSRTSPGSGLGLSLVKAVADLHDAEVELTDTTPGLGVAIRFAGETCRPGMTDLGIPVPLPQVSFENAPFVPGEDHDEDVEYRENEKADPLRVGIAVELVAYETGQRDQRHRICPEPLAQQTDDKDDLHQAVAQKIEGVEGLRAYGQVLGGLEQARGDDVPRILGEFLQGQKLDPMHDRLVAHEIKRDPGRAFDQGVQALQDHADLEEAVNPSLGQAGHKFPFPQHQETAPWTG